MSQYYERIASNAELSALEYQNIGRAMTDRAVDFAVGMQNLAQGGGAYFGDKLGEDIFNGWKEIF
jgi:hypothetical protein